MNLIWAFGVGSIAALAVGILIAWDQIKKLIGGWQ